MDNRKRVIAGIVSLLIYAGILALSSLPSSSLPSGIPDFIPHSIEYFALAFFFIQVFASPRRLKTMAAVLLIVGFLAFLDERHQLSSPGRVFSWSDIGFDLLGATAGMIVYSLLSRQGGPGHRKADALRRLFLLQR